jgi:GNAT superfamily N-acetyltransferase
VTHGSLWVGRADLGDAHQLAHLRYQWRATERGELGLDQGAFEAALVAWMSGHAFTHLPFLARRHDRAIGMAWLALVERVPGPGQLIRRSAYIQSTYVIPPERGEGVGTLLVRCLLDHARQLALDYVAVHPSEASFAFYRRLGFSDSHKVLELRW